MTTSAKLIALLDAARDLGVEVFLPSDLYPSADATVLAWALVNEARIVGTHLSMRVVKDGKTMVVVQWAERAEVAA